jgi:hypothetical protein
MVIVTRTTDIERMKKLKLPLLVFGRRKTGKTFLVRNIFADAYYFFVRRDRSIHFETKNKTITYEELITIMEEVKNKVLVIDEFHRLPNQFLDYIHMKSPKMWFLLYLHLV